MLGIGAVELADQVPRHLGEAVRLPGNRRAEAPPLRIIEVWNVLQYLCARTDRGNARQNLVQQLTEQRIGAQPCRPIFCLSDGFRIGAVKPRHDRRHRRVAGHQIARRLGTEPGLCQYRIGEGLFHIRQQPVLRGTGQLPISMPNSRATRLSSAPPMSRLLCSIRFR